MKAYDDIVSRYAPFDQANDWDALKQIIAAEMGRRSGCKVSGEHVRIVSTHYLGESKDIAPAITIQGLHEDEYVRAHRLGVFLTWLLSEVPSSSMSAMAETVRGYLRHFIPEDGNKLDGTKPIYLCKENVDFLTKAFAEMAKFYRKKLDASRTGQNPDEDNSTPDGVSSAPISQCEAALSSDLPFSDVPLGTFVDKNKHPPKC